MPVNITFCPLDFHLRSQGDFFCISLKKGVSTHGKNSNRCCLQDVEQILIWIKPVFLCGFNHAKDDRAALGTAGHFGKQEVLPANDKRLDPSFRAVVADFQPAVFQVGNQIRPLFQQIVDRLTECRLRRGIPALRPSQKGVPNRLCLLLPLVISFFRTALLQFVLNGKQLIALCPALVNLRGIALCCRQYLECLVKVPACMCPAAHSFHFIREGTSVAVALLCTLHFYQHNCVNV